MRKGVIRASSNVIKNDRLAFSVANKKPPKFIKNDDALMTGLIFHNENKIKGCHQKYIRVGV